MDSLAKGKQSWSSEAWVRALNILFKGKCLIYGKKLPKYLILKKKDVNKNENNNNVNVKVIKNGKIKLKPKTPLSNRTIRHASNGPEKPRKVFWLK